MRHRLRTRILAGVAVVGLLGALLAVVGTTGSGDSSAESPSTTRSREGLDPAAVELLDLLELGRSTTYHAVYEGVSPEIEGTITLETWQSPPRIRQDSELTAEGTTIRTRTIGDDDGVVRCGQVQGVWTCQTAPDATDPLGPVSNATIDQLTRGSVGVRDASVDDMPARCFTLRAAQGTSELCASPDGIVLRVTSAGSEIELVTLERDVEVDGDLFEPPAAVTG